MTLESEISYVSYTGNNVVINWPINFRVYADTDIVVLLREIATQVDTVLDPASYTVSGLPDAGIVNYVVNGIGLSPAFKILIIRSVHYQQSMDIQEQGGFYPEILETQLDKIVQQTQQLGRDMVRAWKAPYDSVGHELDVLPEDHFWKADATGKGVDGGSAADIANAQEYAAEVTAIRDEFGNVAGIVAAATFQAVRAEAAAAAAEETNEEILLPIVQMATAFTNAQTRFINAFP